MVAKRIIPCLDVKEGRTVKGVNFENLRDAGDIVELAARYSGEGADELVFLDITASHDRRRTMLEWVERVAGALRVPFTVGGGIGSEREVEALLRRGADKISINSAALDDPSLIDRLARGFGSQCVVVAIDARQEGGLWRVYRRGGRVATSRELFEWAAEAEARGAGEFLFTSMDHDGTRRGFALEPLARLGEQARVPVIASGGAGSLEDFLAVFTDGKADAALAAGIFHFGEISIPGVKRYLAGAGIPVRL
ncbi:MAG: imidazole glycerol phosphate synthase subunit HisF [Odoribacteraceae bacterium]|jgi:cyclase|nr:imidazole glycerol phosphate synthase subunit HisF [Odoribacteraceae bacterium]